jgi:hypothetical protein
VLRTSSSSEARQQEPRRADAAHHQSACYNIKDNDCVAEQMEQLVVHYPKPNYWQDLINSLMRVSKNDKELLNILRLADGVDVMNEPRSTPKWRSSPMGQGLPGEAQRCLEKGTPRALSRKRAERARPRAHPGRGQDRGRSRQVHPRQAGRRGARQATGDPTSSSAPRT